MPLFNDGFSYEMLRCSDKIFEFFNVSLSMADKNVCVIVRLGELVPLDSDDDAEFILITGDDTAFDFSGRK